MSKYYRTSAAKSNAAHAAVATIGTVAALLCTAAPASAGALREPLIITAATGCNLT
jgi:hypothetical protein